jgi:hypothetical protein
MGGLSRGGILNYYFTISGHLKSGLIRWVASLEENNSLVFNYLRAFEIV